MNTVKFILASNSLRRKELLSQIMSPDEFIVVGSDTQESVKENEDGEKFSMRVAEEKARNVLTKYIKIAGVSYVIGADTVILLNDEVIGKPKDRADAKNILKKLSGNCHEVITGVAVIQTKSKRVIKFAVRSKVWMKILSDDMIEKYIDSGEPMDKAGAYAIQGLGKELIKKFEGSYTNIVGLPVEELKETLS